MRVRTYRYFVGDFETTVYDGQDSTEVWASGSCEMYSEDAHIFHSIDEQWEYFLSLKCSLVCYYHNLKFDGSFWLDYLLIKKGFKLAYDYTDDKQIVGTWRKVSEMENNSLRCTISDMGQWYTITIKVNKQIIEFRDSLKLLPFSLKKIGKSFKTKHQKLDMEYTGYRYAGCEITDEEQEYLKNDLYVIKEALEIMFDQGHNKLTIGSCCLEEFKKTYDKEDYNLLFPKLEDIEIDPNLYKYSNADSYIRRSYKGGWCYLVKGKENQIKTKGTTADVNSLYPSMMSLESGNRYPTGEPHFWKGDYIPDEALYDSRYFFIRIKTRFYIKKNKLPFIQIKGNYLYKGNEALESSDVYDKRTKKYYTRYRDDKGEEHDTRVELTLTMTDYYLMIEHYHFVDFEILDGCWFFAQVGLFDEYINPWKQLKMTSTGAIRELAKLFLNNLCGKMASSMDSSFKVPFIKDNIVSYYSVAEDNKKAGYIAIGSAITSYARNFTIRAAQKNYHGVDKPGFIYADTDSIHCDLPPEQIIGIKVHDSNFCCWKLESCWDTAIFVRQKTYIEHVTHDNLVPVEKPFYNVKCAGMPEKCKDLFIQSMLGFDYEEYKKLPQEEQKYTDEEILFMQEKRTLEDFKLGLIVPGKLMPKRIPGGVLLVDTTYEMRGY